MPDHARLFTVVALLLALSGCMVPPSYSDWRSAGARAHTVAEIRHDPAAFLAAHAGQRVLVEGFLAADQLNRGAAHEPSGVLYCEGGAGREQRVMLPGLAFNRAVWPQALHHRVVVEGIANPPRNLALGGRDVTATFTAGDMVLVLDEARLVSVDWSGAACTEAPYPAP